LILCLFWRNILYEKVTIFVCMPVGVAILFYLWQLLACKNDAPVYFSCYFYNDFSLFSVINLPKNWTLSRKKRSNNSASSFDVLKFSLLITIFSFVVLLLIVLPENRIPFLGNQRYPPPPSFTSVAIQPVQPLLKLTIKYIRIGYKTKKCARILLMAGVKPGRRGGGGTHFMIRGSSARKFKPLPFNILIVTKMVPLSYTYSKIVPLSYTSRISQNN